MKLTQIEAPGHLKHYVRGFWTLENNGAADSSASFRTMADGCPGLIFQHPGFGRFFQGDQLLPELCLYGQSTRAGDLRMEGHCKITGIYFHPQALRIIFGLPAEPLTDGCMNLTDERPVPNLMLAARLAECRDAAAQIRLLDEYLSSRIANYDHFPDKAMRYALSKMIGTQGRISLKALQDELALTERTFERKFKEYIGISPKLYGRICRFQASLHQLRNRQYRKLSDLAYDNEYADQSHLIRSFKQFAGISPLQYNKRYDEVIENFSRVIG